MSKNIRPTAYRSLTAANRCIDSLHQDLHIREATIDTLTRERDTHKDNAEQLEQWWNDGKHMIADLEADLRAANSTAEMHREGKRAAEQIIKDQRAEIQKLRDTIVTQATKLEV